MFRLDFIIRIFSMLIMSFHLSSCAKPVFERSISIDGDKQEWVTDGVPFYDAKPFIMVIKSNKPDGSVEVSSTLLSLPDKSKVYRAKVRGGFGDASLSLNVANGVFTSTTSSATSNETFTALLGAVGTAAGVPANIDLINAQTKTEKSKTENVVQEELLAAKFSDSYMEQIQVNILDPAVDRMCPAVDPWVKISESISNKITSLVIQTLNKDIKKEIISSLEVFANTICDDKILNQVDIQKLPIQRINEIKDTLASYNAHATELLTKMSSLYNREGCLDASSDETCSQIRSSRKIFQDDVVNEIAALLPVSIPNVEVTLFEIIYDEKGLFQYLKPHSLIKQ